MSAFLHPVSPHADDVRLPKRALVRPARSDPDVAILIEDGYVSTGRRGHTVPVHAAHDGDDLFPRMHVLVFHTPFLLLFDFRSGKP
jgi:hypothetical protein